jgi:hypothetical protein
MVQIKFIPLDNGPINENFPMDNALNKTKAEIKIKEKPTITFIFKRICMYD